MNIFEIDSAINALIDDDGEIADFEAFEKLQLDRETKIENIALMLKNVNAYIEALKAEKANLEERIATEKRRQARVKELLDYALDGEKFKTAKCAVSFRNTVSVEVDDDFVDWAMEHSDGLLRFKKPEADKTTIKKLLEDGAEIEHCKLIKNRSVSVR